MVSNSCDRVIHLQDRFQEDPVHMAMIICRNLKEEQKILATAKSVEVKPHNSNNKKMKKSCINFSFHVFLLYKFGLFLI